MENAGNSPSDSLPARISRVIFLILVASLGLIQIPFTSLNIVATDVIFLIAGVLWVVLLALRKLRLRWHSFYWLLFFYFVALFVSCCFSSNSRASFEHLPAQIYLMGLCVLTFNMVGSLDDIRRCAHAWLIGTSFAAVVGLLTIGLFYLSPQNWLLDLLTYHYGAVPVGDYPRITGTFVSASMFCNYLNASMMLAYAAKAARWLKANLAWPLITALFVCSMFTISIGLGGVFLGIGIWFWYVAGQRRPVESQIALATGITIAVAFIFLSVFALSPYPGGSVIGTIPFTNFPIMASGRVLVWRDAIQTFIEYPLVGKGLGLPVANVIFPNSEGSLSLLTDAHNSFLSVASQNGILGFVAFGMITFFLVRRWSSVNSVKPIMFGAGLALLCSFVYQGLTSSFEDARHLWVLIGIFLAAENIETKGAS